MDNFEFFYTDYIRYLANIHIEGTYLLNDKYQSLKAAAFEFYSCVDNIEDWIKNELTSIISRNNHFSFSENFLSMYLDSFIRYELIEDFLIIKGSKYNIESELSDLYIFYKNEGDHYHASKCVAIFAKFSLNLMFVKILITSVCNDLENYQDGGDYTLNQQIGNFIENNFDDLESKFFKKAFSFLDD